MKSYVTFVVEILVSLLKGIYNNIVIDKLKNLLKVQKKELKDVNEETNDIVSDFDHEYELYNARRKEDAGGSGQGDLE